MPSIGTMIVRYWPKLRATRRTAGRKVKNSDPSSGHHTNDENPDSKRGPGTKARRILSHGSYRRQAEPENDEVGLVEIQQVRSKGQASMESESLEKV